MEVLSQVKTFNDKSPILRRPIRYKKIKEYNTIHQSDFKYFPSPFRLSNKLPFKHFSTDLDSREIVEKADDLTKLIILATN